MGDEEGGQSEGSVSHIKAMSGTDVGFVGTVEAFNDLFVETKLRGFFIEVLETYDFVMGEGW